jgi:hypothetical protein
MDNFICETCGTQFPESAEPPESCPICQEVRGFCPGSRIHGRGGALSLQGVRFSVN